MLMNQLRMVKQLPAVSRYTAATGDPVNKQTRSSNQIQAVLMTLPRIDKALLQDAAEVPEVDENLVELFYDYQIESGPNVYYEWRLLPDFGSGKTHWDQLTTVRKRNVDPDRQGLLWKNPIDGPKV